MRMRKIGITLALTLALGAVAHAQGLAPLTVGWERYFSVQWNAVERQGQPYVEGYVRNESGFALMRIQILVDALDAGGQVVAQRIEWLGGGGLPPGTRTYFLNRAPAKAPAYRVRVFAFDILQTASVETP